MVDEVIDHLFLLALLNPEDVPCFQVNDVGGIFVTVMELEFVDCQVFCLLFGLFQRLSILGFDHIKLFQSCFVNILDGMFSQSCQLRNLLISKAESKKILCVGQQFLGDVVMVSLERNPLNDCFPALRADKAVLVQHHKTHPTTNAQMPQPDRVFVVDVHPTIAVRAAVVIDVKIQISMEAIRLLAAFRGFHTCTGIYKIRQHRRNDQTFFKICTCILYLVCCIVHVWNLP